MSGKQQDKFPWGNFPFGDLIGIQKKKSSDGYSEISLEVTQGHLNPMGSVHGAVTFALADTGMALALYSSLLANEVLATLEIKIMYFNPILSGTLNCVTRVLNRGRRFAMLESEILQDSKIIAKASGIYAVSLKRD